MLSASNLRHNVNGLSADIAPLHLIENELYYYLYYGSSIQNLIKLKKFIERINSICFIITLI